MTTERTIRALEDAVYDARQTMDDLVSKVEDLEIENQRLREEIDGLETDNETMSESVRDLEERLRNANRAPGLRPEER